MRILFTIFLLSFTLNARNIEKGTLFPYPIFKTQFGKSLNITDNTRKIIISFTKESGKLVKDFLEKNKGYLHKNSTVYLVDSSQVPTLAKFLFFMPSIRGLDFEVGLIEDEKRAKKLPRKKDKITMIKLKNRVIISIEFLDKL